MTAEELEAVLKAVNANRPQVTQTMNFNGPIGQQIAHVDKIEAHFDKDMKMEIAGAEEVVGMPSTEATPKADGANTADGHSHFKHPAVVIEAEQKRLSLPTSIDTDRTQEYFKKAIEQGLIKLGNGKLSWIPIGNRGGNSQLAYFCGRVFEYKHSINGNAGRVLPEEDLNALFGVTRMYSLLTQVHNAKNIQSWRRKIDELFE